MHPAAPYRLPLALGTLDATSILEHRAAAKLSAQLQAPSANLQPPGHLQHTHKAWRSPFLSTGGCRQEATGGAQPERDAAPPAPDGGGHVPGCVHTHEQRPDDAH